MYEQQMMGLTEGSSLNGAVYCAVLEVLILHDNQLKEVRHQVCIPVLACLGIPAPHKALQQNWKALQYCRQLCAIFCCLWLVLGVSWCKVMISSTSHIKDIPLFVSCDPISCTCSTNLHHKCICYCHGVESVTYPVHAWLLLLM